MKAQTTRRNLKRRKIFRTLFGVFSLSGVLFAFQACYGTPQDFGQDILIQGIVRSASTQGTLAGVKVGIQETGQYAISGPDGTFTVYSERLPEYHLVMTDIDGDRNGVFISQDTLFRLDEGSEVLNVHLVIH